MRELQVLGNGHLKLEVAECQEFFTQDLHEMVRAQLKLLLQQALLVEQDRYLDLGYYEHALLSRRDFRNGFYYRDLVTQLGLLARIRVPRTRKGFRSQLLPRYERRQQAVNNLILLAFLRGISTRQVGQVLEPILGQAYSAQTICNITRELNHAVQQFHKNQALLAFRLWRQAWQHRRPNAVACVQRDLDNLLSFFRVPQSHWKKVRITGRRSELGRSVPGTRWATIFPRAQV